MYHSNHAYRTPCLFVFFHNSYDFISYKITDIWKKYYLLQICNTTILIWKKKRGIPEFRYRDTGHRFSLARQLMCLKWLPFVHTVIGTQVTHTKPHLHYLDSNSGGYNVLLTCWRTFVIFCSVMYIYEEEEEIRARACIYFCHSLGLFHQHHPTKFTQIYKVVYSFL